MSPSSEAGSWGAVACELVRRHRRPRVTVFEREREVGRRQEVDVFYNDGVNWPAGNGSSAHDCFAGFTGLLG